MQPHGPPLNIAFRIELPVLNGHKIILVRISELPLALYPTFLGHSFGQHLVSNCYEFKQEKTKTNKT